MTSQWQGFPSQHETSQKIAQHLNIQPITAQILLNRNIKSLSEAQRFLNPQHPDLSTETLSEEALKKAAKVLLHHIQHKNRILVYGDYDADGMTSTSILSQALRQLGGEVNYYIPDRFSEGYGLGTFIIETLKQKQYACLVTLDCGITNIQEIKEIKEATGVDVIIMDHHTIGETVPDANAILNPKYLDETHGAYHLCTAGIAYKFVKYLKDHHNQDLDPNWFLDLAALGTIADIAPLTGENRILTKTGLDHLTGQKRLGIAHLLRLANFSRTQVSTRDVGFTIAPRLNASGRLEHASLGVKLLLSETDEEAERLAHTLQEINQKRQAMGALIFQDAQEKLTSYPDVPVVALASANWHPGIIGITASQIAQATGKPAVLMAIDQGVARGSARTYGQVNLYQLLKTCAHLFIKFGGHKEAAGFSIEPEKIPVFIETLQKNASEMIQASELQPIIKVDAEINPADIHLDLAKELEKLEPFGAQNPAPLFYSKDLSVIDYKRVGNGNAVKLTLANGLSNPYFDAIGFQLASKINLLNKGTLECLFHVEQNHWNGRSKVQLNITDIK